MDKRRMCPNCRAFITTDDKICPYCQFQVGPRAIDKRSPADALGGLIPHHRFTTTMILLLNTGLYLAMTLREAQSSGGGMTLDFSPRTLVDFGAMFAPYMAQQWWRLITANFLHGGLLHILMNSWVLFDLGPQVDDAFGTSRFLVIYLLSGITGFEASFLHASSSISVGASASICGLIGAMLALAVRDRSSYGAAMRRQYIQWIIYLLIFGFVVPGIDNAAHIGGIASGFVLGYFIGTPGYSPSVEGFWRVSMWFALALTGYAFFSMFMSLTRATGA